MGAPAKDGVPDFDASGLSDEELAGAIMMLGYFEGALVRAGSSPLARGLLVSWFQAYVQPGIIPARAGFTPL